MTQPTARAVHVDQPLTNLSIAYLQNAENFVASRVFPNVPVSKQSDLYYIWDRSFFFRDEARLRAPNTEAATVGAELSTASYFANVWAAKHPIPDQVRANADSMVDLDTAGAELVAHKLLIRKEKDWAAKHFVAGLWGTNYEGVADSTAGPGTGELIQWSDPTSSTPIENMRAACTDMHEQTGMRPNTLVLSQRVMDALEDHPDIIDRIKYSGGVGNTNPAIVSPTALSQLFKIPRILVMGGVENTAAEGNTAAYGFIGGKHALLCHVAPNPGLMTPSAGYTFSWRGYLGQSNPYGFATTRRYREIIRSTEIEGEMAFDQKLTAAELGVFFENIVA